MSKLALMIKKYQRFLTILSSFSCIGLTYIQRMEFFGESFFEIMQNLHLLRLPKSAYFYIGPELLNVSIRRIRLNSRILLNKKNRRKFNL